MRLDALCMQVCPRFTVRAAKVGVQWVVEIWRARRGIALVASGVADTLEHACVDANIELSEVMAQWKRESGGSA